MNIKFSHLLWVLIAIATGCASSSKEEDEFGDEAGTEEVLASDDSESGTDELPAGDDEAALEVGSDESALSESPLPSADALADAGAPMGDLPPPPLPDMASMDTAQLPPMEDSQAALPPPLPESAPVAYEEAPAVSAGYEATGDMDTYVVKRGDTLMKIAFKKYGDLYKWKQLAELNRNKFTSYNKLAVGTVLQLPRPTQDVAERDGQSKYMIVNGDTLGVISSKVYGTKAKWKKIYENNSDLIKNPNQIYAGFFLWYVPEAFSQPVEPPMTQSYQQDMAPPAGLPPMEEPRNPAGDALVPPPMPPAGG